MNWVDWLGFVASAAVLATFCMRSMVLLRVSALASNVLFASYGYIDHLYPVLVLHVILFPINGLRLIQVYARSRETLRVTSLQRYSVPLIRPTTHRDGQQAGLL